ncbi:MAG: FmdB family zinc ribbon protein [Gammaproteobacteria bacterium]
MPIYEYKCAGCGHALEAMQKMSDAPLAECPACGTSQLKRLVSAAGFQLKGTGWYATDFKGGSKKSESKTETTETKTEPAKHGCGKGSCGCA